MTKIVKKSCYVWNGCQLISETKRIKLHRWFNTKNRVAIDCRYNNVGIVVPMIADTNRRKRVGPKGLVRRSAIISVPGL